MRLFIAIDARELRDECSRLQKLLPDEGVSKTEHYHITLKFLGEVQPEVAEKVKSVLHNITAKRFSLQAIMLGVFPSEKSIRVVWLGFNQEESMFVLQRAIDDSLKPLGFDAEKDFHPHITLARVKLANEALQKAIQSSVVKKKDTIVTEFVLYQSISTRGHPVYTPLLRVPLR